MEISYGAIWVCVCCYAMHASGECCSHEQHGGDGCEPLSRIEPPYTVSAGMGWEDHSDDCLTHKINELKTDHPKVDWPDVPDEYECDCETNTHSTSQCEGCGSWLHGERHAMTLFGPAEESANA